jgi:hypothetical protein
MRRHWIPLIAEFCPMTPIEKITDHGGQIVIDGDGWAITMLCAWRIVDQDRQIAGSDDIGSIEKLMALIGCHFTDCTALTPEPYLDLNLSLSNGQRLQILSTSSIEPWYFSHGIEFQLPACPGDRTFYEGSIG